MALWWIFAAQNIFGWNGLEILHWCIYIKKSTTCTLPLGDTKLIFECWKIFHEWGQYDCCRNVAVKASFFIVANILLLKTSRNVNSHSDHENVFILKWILSQRPWLQQLLWLLKYCFLPCKSHNKSVLKCPKAIVVSPVQLYTVDLKTCRCVTTVMQHLGSSASTGLRIWFENKGYFCLQYVM